MSGGWWRSGIAACAVATAVQVAISSPALSDSGTPVFGPEHAVPVMICGNSPTAEAIATGDFTGDGLVDVAMTELCGFGIRVLPGRGDGTFDPGRYFATGVAPDGITAADLDDDGNLDLIVANGIGDIVVLYGDGQGGFAEQGRYFAQGLAPGAIRVADFDRDQRLDFAVAATPSTVFRNIGGRSFTGSTLLAGFASVGLETADFDGDGNVDMVAADSITLNITLWRGDGTGRFFRSEWHSAPASVESVAAADLNGDGRLDLIAAPMVGPWLSTYLHY